MPWKEHHTIFWIIIISDEIKWKEAAEQAIIIKYFTRFRGRGTHKQYFTIKLLFKLRFFSLYSCLHNLIVLTFKVWHYMNNGHNHTVNSPRRTPLELAQVSILERFPSYGLFTRKEGYPCARVILASRLKLALVYKQISQVGLRHHRGQLHQLYRLYYVSKSCVTFFVTSKIWNKTWTSLWKTR